MEVLGLLCARQIMIVVPADTVRLPETLPILALATAPVAIQPQAHQSRQVM